MQQAARGKLGFALLVACLPAGSLALGLDGAAWWAQRAAFARAAAVALAAAVAASSLGSLAGSRTRAPLAAGAALFAASLALRLQAGIPISGAPYWGALALNALGNVALSAAALRGIAERDPGPVATDPVEAWRRLGR